MEYFLQGIFSISSNSYPKHGKLGLYFWFLNALMKFTKKHKCSSLKFCKMTICSLYGYLIDHVEVIFHMSIRQLDCKWEGRLDVILPSINNRRFRSLKNLIIFGGLLDFLKVSGSDYDVCFCTLHHYLKLIIKILIRPMFPRSGWASDKVSATYMTAGITLVWRACAKIWDMSGSLAF